MSVGFSNLSTVVDGEATTFFSRQIPRRKFTFGVGKVDFRIVFVTFHATKRTLFWQNLPHNCNLVLVVCEKYKMP